MSRWFLLLAVSPCFASLIVNSPTVNPSLFTVTQFSTTLIAPNSMVELPDGSIAVASSSAGFTSGSIVRLTDMNHDGMADGPGTVLYSAPSGPLTGLVKVGNYYAVGNLGDHTITLLQPGATPASAFTTVASFNFAFGGTNWEHPNVGMAVRPTPGSPGSFDLVFNVGSEFNNQLSTDKVGLSGLASATLDGDSLYSITINETGASPTASNLQKIATGIRNVVGLQFDSNGNLYFADNAIDGPLPTGDPPPQADELNVIPEASFGSLMNFGYPTCYTQYVTGAQIGSGCTFPLVAFQPLNGLKSEGPGEIALSPENFPAGYNNGVFIGFAGNGAVGPADDQNPVVFYDFTTGQYIHFVENGLPGVGRPVGLLSTPDALFISDFYTDSIWEVTAAAVPEPASLGSCLLGLAALGALFRRAKRHLSF